MSEYTKGDWMTYADYSGDVIKIVVPDGYGLFTIASFPHSEDKAEREANANLIVAAVNACISVNPDNPKAVALSIKDMYEALKGIDMLYAEYCALKPEPLTESWELVQSIVKEAHEAKALAEGK